MRSPNGKSVFVQIVKVPRAQAKAEKLERPMMNSSCSAQPRAATPQARD